MDTYKIIDDGSSGARDVKVFNSDGEEITSQIRTYVITRKAGESPTVMLEFVGGYNAARGDMDWHWKEGLVVAEITLSEASQVPKRSSLSLTAN